MKVTIETARKAVRICRANYNAKLTPEQLEDKALLWSVRYSEIEAEAFMKAILYCLDTNEYFPQIKDINEGITRSGLHVYDKQQKMLDGGKKS